MLLRLRRCQFVRVVIVWGVCGKHYSVEAFRRGNAKNKRMPHALSKSSVIFIDSYNGMNNGVVASELEALLKEVGMVGGVTVHNDIDGDERVLREGNACCLLCAGVNERCEFLMRRLDTLEKVPAQRELKGYSGRIENERDYHVALTHMATKDRKCLLNAQYILLAICIPLSSPQGFPRMRTA